MLNFNELLSTVFTDAKIVTEYVNYIFKNKLSNATKRTDCYYEVHHILPRSLFPEYEYEPDNLVKLSLYDHFVAHYIIAKTKNPKMLYAFNMMNRTKGSMSDDQLDEAAKMYESLKQDFVEVVREQALNRPPMSQKTRQKLINEFKGTVNVVNINTGIGQRITKEEYYSNPDKYVHHMTGKTHSQETKQKMSNNGIKDKVVFHNIKTLELRYEPEDFSHPEWIKGNPIQSVVAKERFKGMLHWTNTITGESTRAQTCPGKDWVQKRTFNNAFDGKAVLLDLRTGKKGLYAEGEIKPWTVVHNKVIIVSDDKVYTNRNKLAEDIGLKPTDANGNSVVNYLLGKSVPKSFLKNDLIELDRFKIIKASEFNYSGQEFI